MSGRPVVLAAPIGVSPLLIHPRPSDVDPIQPNPGVTHTPAIFPCLGGWLPDIPSSGPHTLSEGQHCPINSFIPPSGTLFPFSSFSFHPHFTSTTTPI